MLTLFGLFLRPVFLHSHYKQYFLLHSVWPQWQGKQQLDHQPQSVNCSVIKHRDDIIMRWNISRARLYLPSPVTSPWPFFAYSLTVWSPWRVPRGIRGITSSVHLCPCLSAAAAWGVGVRVQSGRSRAQPGVCIHDLCGLYTEGGDRDDLPRSRSSFPTCWHDDTVQKNVTLQHVRWEMYCFKDSIRVSPL